MKAMKPTASLRFVERSVTVDGQIRTVRVLQQGWVSIYGGHIEWRDVPLVTEAEAQQEGRTDA